MKQLSESSHTRGRLGEQSAVDYLIRSGYQVLVRNFRTRRGEIDIVAVDGTTLVFVEVKSWRAIGFGDLEVSISKRKQRRIIDASRVYLMQTGRDDRVSVRYDLIFLKGDSMEVHHVRDAFTESTWSG